MILLSHPNPQMAKALIQNECLNVLPSEWDKNAPAQTPSNLVNKPTLRNNTSDAIFSSARQPFSLTH